MSNKVLIAICNEYPVPIWIDDEQVFPNPDFSVRVPQYRMDRLLRVMRHNHFEMVFIYNMLPHEHNIQWFDGPILAFEVWSNPADDPDDMLDPSTSAHLSEMLPERIFRRKFIQQVDDPNREYKSIGIHLMYEICNYHSGNIRPKPLPTEDLLNLGAYLGYLFVNRGKRLKF